MNYNIVGFCGDEEEFINSKKDTPMWFVVQVRKKYFLFSLNFEPTNLFIELELYDYNNSKWKDIFSKVQDGDVPSIIFSTFVDEFEKMYTSLIENDITYLSNNDYGEKGR